MPWQLHNEATYTIGEVYESKCSEGCCHYIIKCINHPWIQGGWDWEIVKAIRKGDNTNHVVKPGSSRPYCETLAEDSFKKDLKELLK